MWITGDENGLLKTITLQQKVQQNAEINEKTTPLIKTIGKINKTLSIIKIKTHSLFINQLLVLRKSGLVEWIHIHDGTSLHSIQLSLKVKDMILDAGFYNDFIWITTQQGQVYQLQCNSLEMHSSQYLENQNELHVVAFHSDFPHLMATGGNELELCIWDLKDLAVPKWKAKNVPHDFLDLRVPVFVTAIAWIPKNPNQLVIGTRYHHIRFYDTVKAKKPIMSVEIGEYPITSLCILPDSNEQLCLFSDTRGTLQKMNYTNGKVQGSFKRVAGAITDVYATKDTIASVGLDRTLRLFDSKKNNLLHSVYLKQRLSCLLFVINQEEEELDESPKVDELWDELPIVSNKRQRI